MYVNVISCHVSHLLLLLCWCKYCFSLDLTQKFMSHNLLLLRHKMQEISKIKFSLKVRINKCLLFLL